MARRNSRSSHSRLAAKVLDEGVAEQGAPGLGLLQPLGGFGQRARQRARLREFLLVGVALDHRVRLDLVLDAVEPEPSATAMARYGLMSAAAMRYSTRWLYGPPG
jgi:hypothetical protein